VNFVLWKTESCHAIDRPRRYRGFAAALSAAGVRAGRLSVTHCAGGGAYPAGGSTDPLVRIICDRLSRNLGQTFVVLNQPGGGGNAERLLGLPVKAKA
jgi:hypothetical protein